MAECVDVLYDRLRSKIIAKFDGAGECFGEGGAIPPARTPGACHCQGDPPPPIALTHLVFDWAKSVLSDPDVGTNTECHCSQALIDWWASKIDPRDVTCYYDIYNQAEALIDCLSCPDLWYDCSNCSPDCDQTLAWLDMTVAGSPTPIFNRTIRMFPYTGTCGYRGFYTNVEFRVVCQHYLGPPVADRWRVYCEQAFPTSPNIIEKNDAACLDCDRGSPEGSGVLDSSATYVIVGP